MPHWLGQTIFFMVYGFCVVGLILWLRYVFIKFVTKTILVIAFVAASIFYFIVWCLSPFLPNDSSFGSVKILKKLESDSINHQRLIKKLQRELDDLDKLIQRDSNDFFFKKSLEHRSNHD